MALLGGDKNSPKTSSQQSSSTVTKTDNRAITGGSGSIGGNIDLSGISDNANVNITQTDQGAVSAGLQLGLAALDNSAQGEQSVISAVTQSTHDAIQQAVGVAETVAQGQQNTTFKYVTVILVGIAAVAGLAYYASKR
jgi:hypothetical protein